jgi:hypothetical protein
MGGVVSKAVDFATAPATIISGAVNQLPVIGPIAGPIASAVLAPPGMGIISGLGTAAMNAATGQYGGGGGGGGGSAQPQQPSTPTYASTIPGASGAGTTTPYYSPTYNYGANSYAVDNTPFDTSKYFLQGNKGTYNILPQLANLYDPATQQRAGAPSANIYGDILGQIRMNQDTLAEQNLQKNFGLQSYAPSSVTTSLPEDYSAPSYVREDIQNALGEFYPSGSTPSGVVPVSYADFGFKRGDTLQDIASYAKQQNNPFFMPYAPEDVKPEPEPYRAPTIMPVSSNPQPAPQPLRYNPIQDARGPAPRDIAPASVATSGSFRPAETPSATARTASTEPAAGAYRPVNIRTGGLASLRRS